jgi:hypothetical protein
VSRRRHPLYQLWQGMRARCSNPKHTRYSRYGGRGITVCERWNDFLTFVDDVGPRPSLRHSIDRIDVNGNYEPGNVRWATQREQGNNTAVNLRVTLRGEERTVAEWAAHLGVSPFTLYGRLKRGFSVEEALQRKCYGPVRALTLEEAADVRRRVAAGELSSVIAREFGVSYFTINRIVKGRTYPPTARREIGSSAARARGETP